MTIPAHIRTIAEEVLTEKQLEAWLLWEDDLGYGTIGQKLGLSTSGARNRVHAAIRNIELALEKQGTTPHSVRKSDRAPVAAAA